MAEETLSEALENLNDDNIKSAAVPVHKQPDIEEPQDESTFIDLTDEDIGEVAPITEDEVKDLLNKDNSNDKSELNKIS